jgi:hypothetical protein
MTHHTRHTLYKSRLSPVTLPVTVMGQPVTLKNSRWEETDRQTDRPFPHATDHRGQNGD